jgi:HD-GYP domain-containing protein (c-di-GMP phosphodiesterase class II)
MAKSKRSLEDFFESSEKESEDLKAYVSSIEKETIQKETRLDKIAAFLTNTMARITSPIKKETKKPKSEFNQKLSEFFSVISHKLTDQFNFEAGVDILDDTSVLYRRNKVIRNIIRITNLVFLVFTLMGSQEPNYILIFGFWIIMYTISTTLKRIIKEEPRTLLKQQMAMYIASVYILLASLAVYIKLRVGAGALDPGNVDGQIETTFNLFSITQAGYVLIYFSLVVIALYQDARLLRNIFKWVLVIMTIIHVTIMYPLYLYAGSVENLYNFLVVTHPEVSIDIFLRTLLIIVFNIALYSSVAIGQMMNDKRKLELIKRRDMESDFKAVVGDVFDVIGVFNNDAYKSEDASLAATRVAEIASRLGNVLGLSPNVCTEIYDYSKIHIERTEDLSIEAYDRKEVLTESDYSDIRDKTILGSVIIKRLQLNQKSEDIVRAHFEKNVTPNFKDRMKRIQRSQEGQIILLAEIYEILRQPRNYKTELTHKRALELLQLEFKDYFEPYILDRFIRYSSEFDDYYLRFIKSIKLKTNTQLA